MKVLIADDDEDVRDIITFTFSSEVEADIIEVSNGNEAIEMIQKHPDLQLVICDYNMPNGNGGMVYRYLLDHDIDISYVMCSSEYSTDHEEFNDAKYLLGEITKPNIYEGVQSIIVAFNDKQEQQSQANLISKEAEYCEAGLQLLYKTGELPCDLYMAIGSKFVKVVNRGDRFNLEELEKYRSKGLNSLLVKRSESKIFVEHISKEIIRILHDDNLSSEEKVLDAHAVIMDTVRELGFSDAVIRATETSVNFALDFFEDNTDFGDLTQSIFGSKGNYLTSHSVAIAFLSVGILKKTNWDSQDTRNKMVLASFLHDASVRAPEFSESIFDHESKLLNFKQHTMETIDILTKLKNVPEDLFRIVSDHHERPDGSGFPRGVDATQLKPLSSLFIFCHDVVDAIFALKESDKAISLESVNQIMQAVDYEVGHFKKCHKAFQEAKIFN